MVYKKIISSLLYTTIIFGFNSCAKKMSFEQKVISMNEKEQMDAIKENYYAIQYIKNPTETMQLEAVKQKGTCIKYIKEPTETVQLEAIKQDINSIEYIKNPTEAVQLEAIKQNGTIIQYINEPTYNVQLEAVKNNGYAIEYIKNPSNTLKIEASKTVKYLKYTQAKIKEFTVMDKNLKIEVLSDSKYSISNLTKQFIKVKSISFYYGIKIHSLEDINLPPNSSMEIPFPNVGLDIGNKEIVDFGFAINYLLNEKSFDLYKVNQYPIVEFIYKR